MLRAFAILLVFVFHSQEMLLPGYKLEVQQGDWFAVDYNTDLTRLFWNLVPSAFGWSGVELFLLISGFLIHQNYLLKGGAVRWRDFFSKRFWRIYPPYLLALIIIGFSLGPFVTKDWILHLLLLHNFNGDTLFSINPSFWSLALEAQLYLIYPLFLWLRGRWGVERSVLVVAGISAFTLIMTSVFLPESRHLKGSLPRFWIIWVFGAFIAERTFKGRTVFRDHGKWAVALLLVVPLVSLSFLSPFLRLYLISALHALLLELVVVRWKVPSLGALPAWKRMLIQGLLILGLSSYSFYLVHQPLIRLMYEWLPFEHYIGGTTVEIVLAFTVVALLSYALFNLVERPSIRLGGYLRKRKA